MKKIVIVLALVFVILNYQKKIDAATFKEENIIFNNIEEAKNVKKVSNFYMLEYQNEWVIRSSNHEFVVFGQIECFAEYADGLLFVSFNENRYYLNRILHNEHINIEIDNLSSCHKIMVENSKIYLLGSNKNFSIIKEYNVDLLFIRNNLYFENANITFVDAVYYDNNFYVWGKKEGHSNNLEIENIGNYQDTKSILFIFDYNLNVKSIKYFNHQGQVEEVLYFNIVDNYLFYVFKTNTDYYFYTSNLNLTSNKLVRQESGNIFKMILSVNNDYLSFYQKDELLFFDGNNEIMLGAYNLIYDLFIENGMLNIIHYCNGNLYLTKINEYHINKVEPIIISYEKGNVDFDKDLNYLDEIDIKSYFVKTEVYCNTKFLRNIHGIYNIELLVKRKDLEDIKLSGQVIVNPYVNICDSGVYCKGFVLKFLGDASLNGQKINSGHSINECGEYELVISNNLQESTIYNFIIVDDYYIKNQEHQIYDTVVFTNNMLDVQMNLESIVCKEVIVNNEAVLFEQKDNIIIFHIPAGDSSGVKNYILNKIITENSEYVINKEFKVNILKQIPNIEILENDSINPSFLINVSDPDQTVKFLEIILTNETNSYVYQYYFNNQFIIDFKEYFKGNIEFKLCYDVGNCVINKDSFLNISGEFEDVSKLITISSQIDAEILKNIQLDFNDEQIDKIERLSICNIDLQSKYLEKNNYTNLIVSLSLTILLVGGIVIYIVIKRRKEKTKNKL